ncbi:hypothetical protein [Phenylobacterium sp.]|uniref:hypothetical protein n=1 Tax=Phenylobacterium sp. TaxID=1871053 RepID=UPI0025E8B494|nr:hypothetical protein [Phenylobacterium sp.]
MLIAIAAAGLMLAQAAAPPATTATVAPVTAPAPAPDKPKKPKLICREETQTDSIIPRRVCRTPEQAAAEHEAAEKLLRNCQGPGC